MHWSLRLRYAKVVLELRLPMQVGSYITSNSQPVQVLVEGLWKRKHTVLVPFIPCQVNRLAISIEVSIM